MYYNIYVYNLESRARTPPLNLSILYYSVHFVHLLVVSVATLEVHRNMIRFRRTYL